MSNELDPAVAALVATGRCWFTSRGGYRYLVGPAEVVRPKAIVMAKRSGDRADARVKVGKVYRQLELDGKPYAMAAFQAYTPEIEANDQRRYTTVYDDSLGRGRRYADEPGPTYYDDGSGSYQIQIWD